MSKNYIYINAVSSSNEKKLVGRERIGRMAECETLAECMRILKETPFGGDCSTDTDIESLLCGEQRAINAFVKDNLPNDECAAFCLYRLDFFNAKAIVRSKYLNVHYAKYVEAEGVFSYERLIKATEKDDEGLPKELQDAIKKCTVLAESKKLNGVNTDTIFLTAYYNCLNRLLKTDYLRDIIAFEKDALNISVCLRAGNYQRAKEMLVPLGKLSDKQLELICSGDYAKAKKVLCGLESEIDQSRKDALIAALSDMEMGVPFVSFERIAGGYAIDKLSKCRFEQTGFMPFIYYFVARTTELADIRTVLTCKKNGIDTEQIKKRIKGIKG